ncbi:MAG: glutamate 5-kinase [Acidobacteriota bacterium]
MPPIEPSTASPDRQSQARVLRRPEPTALGGLPDPASSAERSELATARRVVVKLGTRVLVGDDGRLVPDRLRGVVRVAAELLRQGREVLLVSSGAVGLGTEMLALGAVPGDLHSRRACAAVGQSRLMGLYQECFAERGILSAQLLLTEEDFDHRQRYLDLRSTVDALLRRGVVPVLNENDAVLHGTMPKKIAGRIFSDNDRLAALVAAKCDADLLVLLTDVTGVYDRDPRHHDDAQLLPRIDNPRAVLTGIDDAPGSTISRGGMRSKVEAARLASLSGCHAVIACGRDRTALHRAVAGVDVGTWFPGVGSLQARRRWIAFAAAPRGVLHLDAGAVEALRRRRASLLPCGVLRVEGRFERGDVVEMRGPGGELVGRGLMFYDAEEARAWCRGQPPEGDHNCLLRRSHVVLES